MKKIEYFRKYKIEKYESLTEIKIYSCTSPFIKDKINTSLTVLFSKNKSTIDISCLSQIDLSEILDLLHLIHRFANINTSVENFCRDIEKFGFENIDNPNEIHEIISLLQTLFLNKPNNFNSINCKIKYWNFSINQEFFGVSEQSNYFSFSDSNKSLFNCVKMLTESEKFTLTDFKQVANTIIDEWHKQLDAKKINITQLAESVKNL